MTRTWRYLRNTAAALGFLFVLVTVTPVDFWWATKLAGSWNDPEGDVLVVLTGSGLEDGTLGMSSYWRAVYALRFYKQEHFKEILITGGSSEGLSMAESMRNFLVAQGVPTEAVRLDTVSVNTRSSAENVVQILKSERRYQSQRVVLMTSDYHMYRSDRAFQKAGLRLLPRPIPDIRKRYSSPLERWGLLLELLQESAKIVYYRVHGWI